MKCTEAQEQFGSALDGALSLSGRDELFQHLSLCGHCRKEFEFESLTKQIVRKSVRRLNASTEVRNSVLNALRREYEQEAAEIPFWERLFAGRRLFPSLVTALVVIALISYLAPPEPSASRLAVHAASNDVIFQSLQNFLSLREGRLKPKSVACDPTVIKSYFQKNGLHFAADTKIIDDCDWYGALHSEFEGVQLAHVMYQMGDDMTYVYEVKKDDAMAGSTLSIPPAAKESLTKTGWYTDPLHADHSVVVWTSNGTLCAAVSTMEKDRLVAFLSTP
ncbi:MAG: zf-HC2 domain-containing protein [Ignavibacteriales bacterium]|nr:zf-HC2 domain-containing protein [Ignavibacteriales bacterium]